MTPDRTRPLIPLWAALVMSVAAGPVYSAAFPSIGWWPLAFLGIGMMLVPLIGRRTGSAVLLGFLSGLSFFLVQVAWSSLYLGDLPWIALSVAEALYFAAAAPLITLAYRWIPRVWDSRAGRLGLLPVAVAGIWTAREGFAGVWPYGGFAWGRASLSQSQSPFASLAAWLGLSGLTFAIVLLVAFVIECARAGGIRPLARGTLAVAAATLLLVIPAWPVHVTGYSRIAAVQGNGRAGYFQRAEPGDILLSQVKATLPILGDHVDMVVWPEGASDLDPLRVQRAAAVLDQISRAMGAPVVTGTITKSHGRYYNSSLVWEAGEGAVAQYDKRHPVPFGEYIPDRSFWRPFAPSLIDLVQRQYTPGTRPNVVQIGHVKAGISICFDIADDSLLRDMVSGGAQVILAQTNNADFGHTDENEQQLAIARMRAIEAGRSLVNISTVGTSQIIGPDGRTLDSIPAYKPGAMVMAVPLSDSTPPAGVASRGIELLVSGLGLGALVVAGIRVAGRRRSARRAARRKKPDAPSAGDEASGSVRVEETGSQAPIL